MFTSFLFALNNLYFYYNREVRGKVETKTPIYQEGERNRSSTYAEEAYGTYNSQNLKNLKKIKQIILNITFKVLDER